MGHAIYSVSDPRAEIFKKFVAQLAHEKDTIKNTHFMRKWNIWHRKSLPKKKDV